MKILLNGEIISAFGKQFLRYLLILNKHNSMNNFLRQAVCRAALVPLQSKGEATWDSHSAICWLRWLLIPQSRRHLCMAWDALRGS